MAKSSLDKKFDIIREIEESKSFSTKNRSRIISKFVNNKLAVFGLIIFSIILLATIFAPLLSPYDPMRVDLRSMRVPPSFDHWFGTDNTGRDVFTRVLFGGRVSIFIGLGSAILSALVGIAIGCYAGYKGGWIDLIALRTSEIFMSFPQIILVLLLVSILGQSLMNLIIIFTLTGWGSLYRMTRAQMLSLREEEYVQALRAFGLSRARICYKHILPNALGPIMVNITLSTAMFILQEAGLSFLGLGSATSFSWGAILSVARGATYAWWLALFPGIAIFLTVTTYNLVGEGLRDALDPRLKQ